jgi:hydrogenase expression/formation protein HypE
MSAAPRELEPHRSQEQEASTPPDAGGVLAAGAACPLPLQDHPTVLMGHGGGGRLSRLLLEQVFLAAYGAPDPAQLHDGAVLDVPAGRIAFSTDSYVISPLFFPGGDIASLAVHGTINDLAMCAAQPIALSAAFVLEEGLPVETLWRLARSMGAAAAAAGVPIVTGDTKVVDRGKGDGVYINTAGIGIIPHGVESAPRRVRPGDAVLVSGVIASHGIAVLSVREGLRFETEVRSDSAALHGLVAALLGALGDDVHVLRDPTRGGVASALNEIAAAAGVGIQLDEAQLPVLEEVRAACELLGLDPLYVANEGKLIAIVAPERADAALGALRAHPLGRDAALIGVVTAEPPGRVTQRSRIGGFRVVELLSGEQLPRIC